MKEDIDQRFGEACHRLKNSKNHYSFSHESQQWTSEHAALHAQIHTQWAMWNHITNHDTTYLLLSSAFLSFFCVDAISRLIVHSSFIKFGVISNACKCLFSMWVASCIYIYIVMCQSHTDIAALLYNEQWERKKCNNTYYLRYLNDCATSVLSTVVKELKKKDR